VKAVAIYLFHAAALLDFVAVYVGKNGGTMKWAESITAVATDLVHASLVPVKYADNLIEKARCAASSEFRNPAHSAEINFWHMCRLDFAVDVAQTSLTVVKLHARAGII
jgi:hypothetical protein